MNRLFESKRIVIATIGSLGDLHPCLALALELMRRGHHVTIATTPYYMSKVKALGISFQPMRPDWDPTDPDLIRQCDDLKKGPEVLYRKMPLPELSATYADLFSASSHADLLIAGELVYAAPLVAEKLKLRWVSVILSPFSFFSSFDPSVLVNVPALIHLRKGGPSVYRAGLNVGRLATRHWSNPVRNLRREQGLRLECDPVFRDKFSRDLVLALFSHWLAKPQPDWPPQTSQPGFVFIEAAAVDANLTSQLSDFLASGSEPIIFTQGSTVVHRPGYFYRVSAIAAKRLGRRAVLLGARDGSGIDSPDILTLPYAPYSQLFPRGIVNVHQGGSGTTGEALRSGRPMLIVPYGWDQPDNALRVERLGAGLHVSRSEYTVDTATAALKALLGTSRFSIRAAAVREQMAKEDGLTSACNAIEAVCAFSDSLSRQRSPQSLLDRYCK
jgi:UDP:flavonoid glycosyltransferase YjiC (YdhE family)